MDIFNVFSFSFNSIPPYMTLIHNIFPFPNEVKIQKIEDDKTLEHLTLFLPYLISTPLVLILFLL